MDSIAIRPTAAARHLGRYLSDFKFGFPCRPLLLAGSPGIGKTALAEQAAAAAGFGLIVTHPGSETRERAGGLYWPNAEKGYATELPVETLHKLCTATEPTLWLMDDLGQASPEVQAPHMQYLHARTCGAHRLSPLVAMVAATNRRSDRSNVRSLNAALLDRCNVLHLQSHIDDWCDYVLPRNIPCEMVAYLRLTAGKGTLCADPIPAECVAEMIPWQSPRSWEAAGQNQLSCERHSASDADLRAALTGDVGPGLAQEYLSFRASLKDRALFDRVLMDPQGAPIPTEADKLYALATAMTYYMNAGNCDTLSQYLLRLQQEGCEEFAQFTCVSVSRTRKDENDPIFATRGWTNLMCSKIGKSFLGDDDA